MMSSKQSCKGHGTGHATERLYECFRQIDTDKSGEISGTELVNLFMTLGDSEQMARKSARVRLQYFIENIC